MSKNNEEELEFISVAGEDDNELNNYMDPSTQDASGGGVMGSWIFTQSKHPVTIFFHLLFKTLALFLYIFGSWFTSNFIFTFVICIVLLAFDFWTVKNVSDSRMFWGGLYVSPLCWAFLLVVGVLRLQFEYLPIVVAALVLNFANIIGYIKCSSSAKEKMKSYVEQGMQRGSMAALENSSIRNWVLSALLDVTTGGANTPKTRAGDAV